MLAISAPAVSRMLRHTEDQLGYQLFERRSGRLLPTPEAEALWTEADAALGALQRVASLAATLGAGRDTLLRVAANPSFGAVLLPQAWRLLRQTSMSARLDIITTEHQAVMEHVVLRRTEIGVTQFASDHPLLHECRIGQYPMCLAIPANSPLASLERVPLKTVAEHALVTYDKTTPIGSILDAHFIQHGMTRHVAVTVRYPLIACHFVACGAGVAFVDAFLAMGSELPGVVLRPVEPAPSTELYIIRHVHRSLTKTARNFIKAVEQVASAH